jgi:hypothetical protein
LRDELIFVVPKHDERFRPLHSDLKAVCRRFNEIMEDQPFELPDNSAVYVLYSVKSFANLPKLSRWMGLPLKLDHASSLANLQLRFSVSWTAIEKELNRWSRSVIGGLPALRTIEIQWRPRYSVYRQGARKSYLTAAEAMLRGFDGIKMSIDLENGVFSNGIIAIDPMLWKSVEAYTDTE